MKRITFDLPTLRREFEDADCEGECGILEYRQEFRRQWRKYDPERLRQENETIDLRGIHAARDGRHTLSSRHGGDTRSDLDGDARRRERAECEDRRNQL